MATLDGSDIPNDGRVSDDAKKRDVVLVPLRRDLRLLPSSPDRDGRPAWTIHDPVRNRYYRVGPAQVECLSRWSLGTVGAVVDRVAAGSVYRPAPDDILALMQFLQANGLLERSDSDVAASFSRIAKAGKPVWWKQMMHGYLFFRIPLVRPTTFLRATQGAADLVAGRGTQTVILILGAIGLFLVSRQWDVFLSTFQGYLNWQGALSIGVTLIATKILHELGHAYTVTRYGGRVPTMGVAFLVLYPVLYTDTTDAYRFRSQKARLAVGTAGIRVELAIALLATFLWSFLPDGPVRSAAFLAATATWITTLLINLSPFLRFDGYYILADWLDIPNLQPRAFAMTRWWLREALFGFGEPPPEPFPRGTRRILILYGFGTWIYRFFLFLGIALLVYHLFFKLAGIVLFLIEIFYFILMPILKEFYAWVKMRRKLRPTVNLAVTLTSLAGGIWLFVTPWQTEVSAGALIRAQETVEIVTALPGRLSSLEAMPDRRIEAGQTIAQFSSPRLEAALVANAARLRKVHIETEQARLIDQDRGDVARLEEEFRGLESARARIEAQRDKLTVTAPSSGVLRDVPDALRGGVWVASGTVIGRIVSSEIGAIAYVDQADLPRVAVGAAVRIIPEDASREAVPGRVTEIDGLGAERLANPHFTTAHGGGIPAVEESEGGGWVPLQAVYRVAIALDAPPAVGQPLRGTAHIEAPAESYARRFWRTVGGVIVRESGF